MTSWTYSMFAKEMPGYTRTVCVSFDICEWFPIKYSSTSLALLIQDSLSYPAAEEGQIFILNMYCMSKKSWPFSYRKLVYKVGQGFLADSIHMIRYD